MSPDSFSGIYITSKLRQLASIVTVNEERVNKEKEVRKAETYIKT